MIYLIKYLIKLNHGSNDLDIPISKDIITNDFIQLFSSNNMKDVLEDCIDYGLINKLFFSDYLDTEK